MIPSWIRKDPIWSKVFTAAVVALMLYLASFIPGFYPWFVDIFTRLWGALTYKVNISVWVLILISIPAIGFVTIIGLRLVEKRLRLDPKSYTTDVFWDVVWSWSNIYSADRITRIHSLCPSCHIQIFPEEVFNYGRRYGEDASDFKCNSCANFNVIVPISKYNLNEQVTLQIQKKLRSGEWENVVRTQAKQ